MAAIRTDQKRIHRLFISGSELFQNLSNFMSFALDCEGTRHVFGNVKIDSYRFLDIIQLIFVDRTERFLSIHQMPPAILFTPNVDSPVKSHNHKK